MHGGDGVYRPRPRFFATAQNDNLPRAHVVLRSTATKDLGWCGATHHPTSLVSTSPQILAAAQNDKLPTTDVVLKSIATKDLEW